MTPRILIHGGLVVRPNGVRRLDVLIEGERITVLGPDLSDQASDVSVVEAKGLAIFPGLIDIHVHLREPGGEQKETITSGTSAALAGGVTTVFAMPNTAPPLIDESTFREAAARVDAHAVCDVGLFVGATPDNAAVAAGLAGQAVGLKMYVGSSTGSLLVDQLPAQVAHFEQYPHDRVIAVHAEDEVAVQYFASRGQRRPPICAGLAVAHVLALAEFTGRRLHVCHVSTGYEMVLIGEARRRGLDVTCEVCPHHLFLTLEEEQRIGSLARVNPPLRDEVDVTALWNHLDQIDCFATDHAPHTQKEKASGSPPSGMPGLETLLPLLLTAYHEGRLTLSDIARRTAARPAEIFGLSHKGRLEPGCDADLTLVDLDAEWTITDEQTHTRCGWSPFAGRRVRGRVEQVYLRGRKAFENDTILTAPGDGRLITPG